MSTINPYSLAKDEALNLLFSGGLNFNGSPLRISKIPQAQLPNTSEVIARMTQLGIDAYAGNIQMQLDYSASGAAANGLVPKQQVVLPLDASSADFLALILSLGKAEFERMRVPSRPQSVPAKSIEEIERDLKDQGLDQI